jgi:transposase
MANKTLKKHYQRKVEEVKSKILVINNIRNKLIHRICSYIKNEKLFEVKKNRIKFSFFIALLLPR